MTEVFIMCVLLFFFLTQVCVYTIGSVFDIIVMLINNSVANEMLSIWHCTVQHFSVFIVSSILTKSPAPLTEMESQTMAETPPCLQMVD